MVSPALQERSGDAVHAVNHAPIGTQNDMVG